MSLRPPTKQIGAFLLGVLTFAAIAGLPNAQTLAADGLSSVFLLVLGAIITLTPTALISGELATMYIADGGVYTWVSAAFGPRMGFMCIFVQWAVQLILIVTVLAYLTATLGIAFGSTSFGANRWAIMGVVGGRSKADELGLKPRLRLVARAEAGVEPSIMGSGPIPAVQKVMKKAGMTVDQMDVIELNEAFASVAAACTNELGLDPEKTNPNGGAIALGHPVGATGAILTVKLMYELERQQARYGLVSLCIGGGQGIATIFERVP